MSFSNPKIDHLSKYAVLTSFNCSGFVNIWHWSLVLLQPSFPCRLLWMVNSLYGALQRSNPPSFRHSHIKYWMNFPNSSSIMPSGIFGTKQCLTIPPTFKCLTALPHLILMSVFELFPEVERQRFWGVVRSLTIILLHICIECASERILNVCQCLM